MQTRLAETRPVETAVRGSLGPRDRLVIRRISASSPLLNLTPFHDSFDGNTVVHASTLVILSGAWSDEFQAQCIFESELHCSTSCAASAGRSALGAPEFRLSPQLPAQAHLVSTGLNGSHPFLHGATTIMNSLNLLSASVLGRAWPEAGRARSNSEGSKRREQPPVLPKRAASHYPLSAWSTEKAEPHWRDGRPEEVAKAEKKEDEHSSEETPLLGSGLETKSPVDSRAPRSRVTVLAQRIVSVFADSVKWVLSKAFAPGAYLLAFFYTEDGRFAPLMPLRRLRGKKTTKASPKTNVKSEVSSRKSGSAEAGGASEKMNLRSSRTKTGHLSVSDSEIDKESTTSTEKGTGAVSSSDESTTSRRSIRIRQNEETARKRRQKKRSDSPEEVVAKELKSPTSPNSSNKATKYPHVPAPPRPLIPRRQPSHLAQPSQSSNLPRKTLVLDLDETLIHSMAKGGRMSTGHMVEVKLSAPAAYNGVSLGPQHPILYYVHKRPHCDEFLRQVSKWYNLVIFTASVQEYADPVINWLEQERKYFSNRYYRQHCTFRTGAYIKDLGSIEPDLSKVMILDNSPLSYIFHEDNAIPIEGWINDPTDNDLLHLIPLFEALQHVTDVRALLGLRRGEASQQSN